MPHTQSRKTPSSNHFFLPTPFTTPTFTDINALLPPTNFNSQATGVNDAGSVVGFYLPTATTSVGFLDQNGVITTLDPFGSTFTQARDQQQRRDCRI